MYTKKSTQLASLNSLTLKQAIWHPMQGPKPAVLPPAAVLISQQVASLLHCHLSLKGERKKKIQLYNLHFRSLS